MRNTLIKAIIIAMPLSRFTAGTLSTPPLSLSGHLAVHGLCVSIWSIEGKKMKAKVAARSLPAYISFFSPLEDSQGRKPSPAPQPSAMPQELPGSTPTEALSGELCLHPLTGIQHPVAGGSSLSEVICVFEKSRSGKPSLNCTCTVH